MLAPKFLLFTENSLGLENWWQAVCYANCYCCSCWRCSKRK